MAIIFKTVRWKNLLSTGNLFTEVNLISSPSTLIIGENGAGKSTFIEAISVALYGKAFRKINKPQLINSINQKQMLVELEFSIGNKEYLVRRGMKPNVFEIFQDGNLLNQDAANTDYQEYLEKHILKMNHKSFTQIVTLGSRSYIPFMQLTAAARREVIEDLLDLQIFSAMNTILKQKVSDNKTEIKDIKSSTELVQEKIRLQKEYIKNIEANNDKQIETNKQKIFDFDMNIKSWTIDIQDLQSEIIKLTTEYKLSESDSISKKLKNLSSLETQFSDKLKNINNEVHFYDENDNCPTCKQSINEQFKHDTVEKKNVQAKEIEDALNTLTEKYKELNERMTEMTEITLKISELNVQITELNIKISQTNDFKDKIAQEIVRLEIEHKENSDDKNRLEILKSELTSYISSHEELLKKKSMLDTIAILLKDGGIKAKIIKQYIPIINKLINKYLAAMELSCSFELDENFNEVVRSRHRDEFSYESFSEGEKARIDLAILFSWRSVAKLRNANSSNLLILDETFDGPLDATGTEELLKIISSITSDSNVFVISHKGDSMIDKFTNIIKFEKHKNFSRIAA